MAAKREDLVLPGARDARVPVLTVRAKTHGPCAVITANLHGDECTGIAVVHRLAEILPKRLVRGTVVLYPSLNPEGLERGTRRLPVDDTDPNRLFPGDPAGTPSEQHVHALWEHIRKREPSLLVDLHTDSGHAIPYALVDRAEGTGAAGLVRSSLDLALGTGLTVLHEYPPAVYFRYSLDRSLTGAALNRLRIPAVTLEVGPRRLLDPTAVEIATSSALGVLDAAGLVDARARPHESRVAGSDWRRESGPRCSHPGVLVPLVLPGASVGRRQALCEVRSLDGHALETLTSARSGFVVAWPDRTHVPRGLSCATLAVRDR